MPIKGEDVRKPGEHNAPRFKIKHGAIAHIEGDLLRLIRTQDGLSRVELARALNLAPSTVGIYVDHLINEGFLSEGRRPAREFGRPPAALSLNAQGGRFVGVDFEARNIMVTAFDFSQKPLQQFHDTVAVADSVEAILDKIERAVREMVAADTRPLLAIGVGLPASTNIPLVDRLSRRFSIPVFLENNIRSLALAELWFGQGRGLRDFICLGMRSGIGAGIILDGRLCHGANNLAGEIGAWPCLTGSGLATLEEIARLRDLDAARTVGLVLSQLNCALNPVKVILSGEFPTFGTAFLERVTESFRETSPGGELPPLVISDLGKFNGAIGAAALAVQEWQPGAEARAAE
jgi:N-acetylglucosamine repressor